MMDYRACKSIGVVASVLWLLGIGLYVAMKIMWAEESLLVSGQAGLNGGLESFHARVYQARLFYAVCYVVFGMGPVLGFVILMKKRNAPIEIPVLIVLAIIAALPIAAFLMFLL